MGSDPNLMQLGMKNEHAAHRKEVHLWSYDHRHLEYGSKKDNVGVKIKKNLCHWFVDVERVQEERMTKQYDPKVEKIWCRGITIDIS